MYNQHITNHESASKVKTSQKACTPPESSLALVALGAHLRTCRVAKRMTHEEVAQAAGFSRQTLSRIERGDPSVSIGQVTRYALLVGAAPFNVPAVDVPAVSRQRVRRTNRELSAPATH